MKFGLIRKFYKKTLKVDVLDYYGMLYENVILPGNYTSKNKEYIGRIRSIKKGQMVLFDKIGTEEEYTVIQFLAFNYGDENKYLENFIKKVPSEINYEDDFVDFQKEYAVIYKGKSIMFVNLESEKKFFEIASNSNYKVSINESQIEVSKYSGGSASKVFSFDPASSKLSIEKSGKTVTFNLSDASTFATIGKGDMSVVNTKELKDWMKKTQESIQGIIDAISGGVAIPMDGGASLKSTISAKITKMPPKVPDDIDNTNIKISKKGN